MSQLINLSLDMTLLVEMVHKGHSAFNIGKNGKTYVNVQAWINDEPDKFGDHASLKLNSAKDMGAKDQLLNPINPKDGQPGKNCYVGRGKKSDLSPKPLDAGAVSSLTLPGQSVAQPAAANAWQQQNQANNSGGLPF